MCGGVRSTAASLLDSEVLSFMYALVEVALGVGSVQVSFVTQRMMPYRPTYPSRITTLCLDSLRDALLLPLTLGFTVPLLFS